VSASPPSRPSTGKRISLHFAEVHVARLVKQNKERVADDKFHPVDSVLLRKVVETRLILMRTRNLFDSFLK
jgi:hypothetical protein